MSSKLASTDVLTLPKSDVQIPRLALGVYKSEGNQCTAACLTALKAGYRHIDSAQYYANEAEVGEAIRQSGLKRSDIFVTTKILESEGSVEANYAKMLDSVKKIDGENGYVDLFLSHMSHIGRKSRKEIYLALEKLLEAGKTRSIGVSNWGIADIEELKSFAKIYPPHVNQIELHPFCQQREVVKYCQTNGIIVEAYCPLVRNTKGDDPTLNKVAQAHKKSVAQVLIRYGLQKNWVTLPKSSTPERIIENFDVYDFELSSEDMESLDALDQGSKGALVIAVRNEPEDL
ncbi:BgTH12-03911 [Blumeria graminis f. sp. triticale]|uniref:Bgt-822 n=3 Tax=Blumeria graminis TaxID=34373 RepID=A0A381L7Q9_BLUGR|nr:xylose and arabinose reductase member of the aldo-keto reductase family [Blumeria graminis f. sp. tritici 96224]CAD6499804.1 BgTH12-03911 [Blumeria graminis f. sp. triticale]VCU39966.1 Bgt-822 [Blumeria graminis f. sp. tritici]